MKPSFNAAVMGIAFAVVQALPTPAVAQSADELRAQGYEVGSTAGQRPGRETEYFPLAPAKPIPQYQPRRLPGVTVDPNNRIDMGPRMMCVSYISGNTVITTCR